MTSWRPQTNLEHGFVSMQPDYNFIYGELTDVQKKLENGYHSRPAAHLDFLAKKTKEQNSQAKKDDSYSNDLHAIRFVQKMVGPRQLGMPINYDDVDDLHNVERETVAMIRHCGMGPTVDASLNEKTTIPTLPLRKDVHIVRNGPKKFPVIFDDKFFEMESTRMRNARLLKDIDSLKDQINGIQIDEPKPNLQTLTVLNEDEVEVKKPTEAEIAAKDYQKFIEAYPALGNDKNKMSSNSKSATKTNGKPTASEKHKSSNNSKRQMNTSKDKKRDNFRSQDKNESGSNSTYSTNSSTKSGSVYNSFKNSDSSSSSTYLSANESLSWRRKSQTSNAPSFSSTVQNNRNLNGAVTEQKRYYTPKELYEKKRQL